VNGIGWRKFSARQKLLSDGLLKLAVLYETMLRKEVKTNG
jgi:hypothetical protein